MLLNFLWLIPYLCMCVRAHARVFILPLVSVTRTSILARNLTPYYYYDWLVTFPSDDCAYNMKK